MGTNKDKRVLMAMSGGIDSSVAAILLSDAGYEIVGVTMKTWDYESSGNCSKETGCCSIDSINDARELAVRFGFPHYTLDLKDEFEKHIVSDFVSEYMSGRTPNPCVLCNTFVKWDALIQKADMLDCQFIATGHYSFIEQNQDRYFIRRGTDINKDQSYVLWGLSQENLARTLFPLSGLVKDEVRKIAKERGFDNLVTKRESYEICFVPNDDYRAFLKHRNPAMEKELEGGDFLLSDGTKIGEHKGYPFYTIGQRKGLNVAVGHPLYVLKIIPETNTIILGTRDELYSSEVHISKINYMKYGQLKDGMEVFIKIRYNDKGETGKVYETEQGLKVVFDHPVSAVTPGQSAVLYENDDLIAGGIISG